MQFLVELMPSQKGFSFLHSFASLTACLACHGIHQFPLGKSIDYRFLVYYPDPRDEAVYFVNVEDLKMNEGCQLTAFFQSSGLLPDLLHIQFDMKSEDEVYCIRLITYDPWSEEDEAQGNIQTKRIAIALKQALGAERVLGYYEDSDPGIELGRSFIL